jgi:hypothetical protein
MLSDVITALFTNPKVLQLVDVAYSQVSKLLQLVGALLGSRSNLTA